MVVRVAVATRAGRGRDAEDAAITPRSVQRHNGGTEASVKERLDGWVGPSTPWQVGEHIVLLSTPECELVSRREDQSGAIVPPVHVPLRPGVRAWS